MKCSPPPPPPTIYTTRKSTNDDGERTDGELPAVQFVVERDREHNGLASRSSWHPAMMPHDGKFIALFTSQTGCVRPSALVAPCQSSPYAEIPREQFARSILVTSFPRLPTRTKNISHAIHGDILRYLTIYLCNFLLVYIDVLYLCIIFSYFLILVV